MRSPDSAPHSPGHLLGATPFFDAVRQSVFHGDEADRAHRVHCWLAEAVASIKHAGARGDPHLTGLRVRRLGPEQRGDPQEQRPHAHGVAPFTRKRSQRVSAGANVHFLPRSFPRRLPEERGEELLPLLGGLRVHARASLVLLGGQPLAQPLRCAQALLVLDEAHLLQHRGEPCTRPDLLVADDLAGGSQCYKLKQRRRILVRRVAREDLVADTTVRAGPRHREQRQHPREEQARRGGARRGEGARQ
mmetsp:Transcript_33342/g.83043  ORF Transcript_33342/g.83043 Transcript_33342/m.83043 type:complete len:247 (-) Transcript_33342:24-764(-)